MGGPHSGREFWAGFLPLGEVSRQKGTHPNRGTTADVVTGLSIALAWVDESRSFSFLHGQLVSISPSFLSDG